MSKPQKHGKKETHKGVPHQPANKPASASREKSLKATDPAKMIRRLGLFLFVIATLLYIQTTRYAFTLDDSLLIVNNKLTTQGIKALPEIFSKPYLYGSTAPDDKIYRPVSKAVFAICWSLSPEKPFLFHLVNVLLFALAGMLLFLTLQRYMGNWLVPFILSLLFIAHPVHTEVVCNIKSMDEILCFLFFILSLFFLYDYIKNQKAGFLVFAALSYFLCFLSKESGITFLVIFPLAAFFANANKKQIITTFGAMVLVLVAAFAIRFSILSSKSANPVLESDNIMVGKDFLVQKATAIYLLGKYLLLLIFPHPLVCDYSVQQIMPVSPGNILFIISLLFFSACLVYAVWTLRKKNWFAFAILFFFTTFSVTSNIFFLCGSHFAERFLFVPSLGFCMALALLLDKFIDTKNKNAVTVRGVITNRPLLTGLVFLLVLLYGIKIVTQNPVWKDNISLFEHGVKISPKSYRMHLALAQDLSDPKHIDPLPKDLQQKVYYRAIDETRKSLTYYRDIDAWDMEGNLFYMLEKYDSALYYYQKGLEQDSTYENLNFHVGKAYDKMAKYDEAIPYLDKALAKNPKNDGVLYNLALSYTNKNNIDKGLEYFQKVLAINPEKVEALYYSGLIYKAKGNMEQYNYYMQKVDALGGMKAP